MNEVSSGSLYHHTRVPTDTNSQERWSVEGKFFRHGGNRIWCSAVTFGPFPGGWPRNLLATFQQITVAGFNAIRIYQIPDRSFLDAAERAGLKVIAGLAWHATTDFLAKPELLARAHVLLAKQLAAIADHPALAIVLVGNEIPGDLVRWMGPTRVLAAIEALIETGRAAAPHCIIGYANYPTTEYLEPENADFTAMNIYLEDTAALSRYLQRLHHIAGDRPLLITEFGLDSKRNGVDAQASLLHEAILKAHQFETAGMTVYAWSDSWWNGREVLDWDFGLVNRFGNPKPALHRCQQALGQIHQSNEITAVAAAWPVSIIICTRNGRQRIAKCLEACLRLTSCNIEIMVVDDGSTDGTGDLVSGQFPGVRLIAMSHAGLSVARNTGAAIAWGRILAFTDDDCAPDPQWVERIRHAYLTHGDRFAAIGGPNLPPPPQDSTQAAIAAALGAPCHVMIDDVEAEHLPGCNLTVMKKAFDAIGGFDPDFRTAGDDVDFCWRLRDAGFRLGFAPGAFVWHDRRTTIAGYLRQQIGYGAAEAILLAKHPHRFTVRGDARWYGMVYAGGPIRVTREAIIYHGPMGTAGYQGVVSRSLPCRGIAPPFRNFKSKLMLQALNFIQPALRAWKRNGRWCIRFAKRNHAPAAPPADHEIHLPPENGRSHESYACRLQSHGWQPGGSHDFWDLEKNGTRILFATERGDGEVKNILLRIWGARETFDKDACDH